MTPAEVILMGRGYLLKRSKEWEQTRIIAYTIETTKKIKGRHPSMRKFMPLPTDKKGQMEDPKIRRMLDTLKRVKAKQQ